MIKNTLWNILGLIIPSLVAIPAMAVTARVLGVEKFGIFMLAFSVLGYASIFDGGLTRAVIRSVALHDGDTALHRRIIGTASYAVLAISTVAMLLLYFGANYLAVLLNVSEAVLNDTVSAFRLLAFVIPPYLLSLVWFAYPEGRQQFQQLNILKTVTGSLIALLPVAGVLIKPNLVYALAGLLVARFFTLGIAYFPCNKGLGRNLFSFDTETLRGLLRFGGWITVSNMISPLMVYADRFLLSNLIGANRVAIYTAPSEAIARMSIIPGAVSRTIFPLFSKLQGGAGDHAKTAFWGLFIVCSLTALPVFIFATPILTIWLGESYGTDSPNILRILLIGFIFNAIAQIPFARIQASGHSKVTALLHLAELFPYIALLTLLVHLYGLYGAAIAWTVRVIADYFLLEILARKGTH